MFVSIESYLAFSDHVSESVSSYDTLLGRSSIYHHHILLQHFFSKDLKLYFIYFCDVWCSNCDALLMRRVILVVQQYNNAKVWHEFKYFFNYSAFRSVCMLYENFLFVLCWMPCFFFLFEYFFIDTWIFRSVNLSVFYMSELYSVFLSFHVSVFFMK